MPNTSKYDAQTLRELEKAQEFFEACRAFWTRQGDRPDVAFCKAFWWDCVECWNFDKSWNAGKRAFVEMYRSWYSPYAQTPAEKIVAAGGA